MDINDSNKSQQTGGLKLMTVFIAVLALHVVVIGGFTVYHLMSGGSSDTDMTAGDKTHKGLNGSAMTESTLPDPTQVDKTTVTPPTEVATIPSPTAAPAATTPAPEASASTTTTPDANTAATAATSAPVPTATPEPSSATTPVATANPTPASTLAPPPEPTASTVTPAPDAGLTSATSTSTEAPSPAPVTEVATPAPQAQAPTGPISPQLAPPEAVPVSAPAPQPAPASAFAAGPVHMPPPNVSPEAPRVEHEHMQIYIVKITDSYKKIAHRHHITVAQLKEANHITGNVLHTGQKLFIPSDKTEVAERASTSTLDAAPTASEAAAPMTTGLTSTSTTLGTTGLRHHLYTVVKGDTLTRIAHRYKTTASAIMAENGITDPTKLSIGKKLRIPSSEETRSARNSVPASTEPGQVQAKTGAATAQLANYGN